MSRQQKLSVLSVLTFLLLGFLSLVPQSYAATFDLQVAPPIFQIELTPPAVANIKEQITLENRGDDPMDLMLSYLPFKPVGENGEIEYLKDGKTGGSDPLIFEKIAVLQDGKRLDTIHIPPKTKRNFDLAVTIPKDEPPSDYYFTLLFANQESATPSAIPANSGSVSQSLGGIGINVLLSIGPKTRTKGAIEEFSTDFIHSEGPIPFMVKIRNDSPHFIYPTANIVIKNMFGQTIGKVDLLPVNILSESTRSLPSREQFVYAADGDQSVDKDNKRLQEIVRKATQGEQLLAIWPEKFLFGPYTATLTVALSDKGPLYVQTTNFIGLPLHLIIGFGIAVILLFTIRSRLKHRTKVKS